MRRLLVLCALALGFLSACNNNCTNLANQLCNCAANTNDRNNCLQGVAQRSTTANVTDADNALCGALIPQCDCHTVGTVQGKYACGLARLPIP